MSLKDVVKTLLRIHPNPDHDLVLFEFRLPRIVIGILVGSGLAIAGAVIQGVTRNGLADPGILGINAGAGAAMVVFLFFYQGQIKGEGWLPVMASPMFGLSGGLLAAVLLYVFSWKDGRLDPQRLLLTGLAIASGLGAASLYLTLKMNAQDLETAAMWISGSIYNANWTYILSIIPWYVAFVPLLYSKSRKLDAFYLGEDSIRSLGIRIERERTLLLFSAIGLVSACVSVSGGIGFIGLISPHISRRLVGHSHKLLLPICALVGALLVVAADFIGRTLFAPAELPVGMVIAVIGVPAFMGILYKRRGRTA